MKALSLWQPWATLMAIGAKHIETRSWSTHYRGPLAICATKNWNDDVLQNLHLAVTVPGLEDDWSYMIDALVEGGYKKLEELPLGAVVGIVDVVDCLPSDLVVKNITARENAFGDYGRGRFGIVTVNPRKLEVPVPVVGKQRLFDIDFEVKQ